VLLGLRDRDQHERRRSRPREEAGTFCIRMLRITPSFRCPSRFRCW
jgi:hypothetical protein